MTDILKAVSVKQPWVWAMYELPPDVAKRIENRTWFPRYGLKPGDRIAIHASKGLDVKLAQMVCEDLAGRPIPADLPRGTIVGTAIYRGWIQESRIASSPDLLRYVGDRWFFGPYGWVLDDLKVLPTPVECAGQLLLWNVPVPIVKRIREAGCL